MCVVTIAFPPSKNFEEYLKDFIRQHFTVVENRVDLMARHAYRKIIVICKRGPRGKVPSSKEIERALDAAFNPSVFGETLEDIMKLQRAAASSSVNDEEDEEGSMQPQDVELKVPKILMFLTESIIQLNGFKSEGIFRVPGDADEVNDLKVRIEKGIYSLGDIHDPNVPGSLLKFWMRDLAEPLIPGSKYEACIDIGRLEGRNGAEQAVKLIESLPEVNKAVAIYVINFLKKAAAPENQVVTKMTIANIAMVFAPNFLRCPSDNPICIFENTKFEQSFLRKLIEWSPF
jgi:Rho GTPase-activating protein 39